jgi:hypothetical protein
MNADSPARPFVCQPHLHEPEVFLPLSQELPGSLSLTDPTARLPMSLRQDPSGR